MELLVYAKVEPIGGLLQINSPERAQLAPPKTEAEARAKLESLARRMGAKIPEHK